MSARRRRAALSAAGALLAALICALLASAVGSAARRDVLILLSLAWLVVTGFCVAAVLRTADAAPTPPDPDVDEPA